MNLSGESVQPAAAFFKLSSAQVLVIHDELDLPLGRVQLKRGGGTGGHNGLKSVAARLGTPDFLRLRLGIGRPPEDFRGPVADFVLQAFAPSEGPAVDDLLARAADAVELLVKSGEQAAMNQINRRQS
jgi:PTH1 family peptidyl-tRNA hydrolase